LTNYPETEKGSSGQELSCAFASSTKLIMLTKSIETFQTPHYPSNRGHPQQLLTKGGVPIWITQCSLAQNVIPPAFTKTVKTNM